MAEMAGSGPDSYDALDSIELEPLIEAVRGAGGLCLDLQKNPELKVSLKSDKSKVTEADLLCEDRLVDYLKSVSDYRILSEERMPAPSLDSGPCWVMDPIDGTSNFARGGNEFAISLALVENYSPVLGLVFAPALDKLYLAELGGGAELRGPGETRKLRLEREAGGLIFVSSRSRPGLPESGDFQRELKMASAALKACSVAEGMGDVYFESSTLRVWDIAAAALIVSEAGGLVRDALGGDFDLRPGENNKLKRGFLVASSERALRALDSSLGKDPGLC